MSKEIFLSEQKPFISVKSKDYGNGKYEAELCLQFTTKDDNDIDYNVKLDYDIKRAEAEREEKETESKDDIILDISATARLEVITEEYSETEEFQAKWSVYLESYLVSFGKEYGYGFVPSRAEVKHSNFGKSLKWLNKRLLLIPGTIIAIPITSKFLKIPTIDYSLSYGDDDDDD